MKLFISYSRDDKAWVYELWRTLRDEGHDAWIDQRILPASDWWACILDEIEACECFIYVMTPKAVDSIYCRAELDYALALNKPVLPLMLKPCDVPKNLSERRVQYQTITDDMDIVRVVLKIEQGLRAIEVALAKGDKYQPQTAPRPDEPKPKQNPKQLLEVFKLAEDAAAEKNYSLAEQLFQRVVDADPGGTRGKAAAERLAEIQQEQEIENILQMAQNPNQRKGAAALYRSYVAQYRAVDHPVLNALLKENTPPRPVKPKPSGRIQRELDDLLKENISPRPVKPPFRLPDPFAWVDIPAGKVILEDGHGEFDVPAFQIGKYPITVAQYKVFMDDDGYSNNQWWSEEGWKTREEGWDWIEHDWKPSGKVWTQPCFWGEKHYKKFFQPDHPIIGVSWYESLAFCNWLSAKTDNKILIPTEQQWQRAVQGDDGRIYPWGDDWDYTRCNNSVKPYDSNATTLVEAYEDKNRRLLTFDVQDMAGNVWEWTLTEYATAQSDDTTNSNRRVLRGGSWRDDVEDHFCVVYRNWNEPLDRSSTIGFRLARS